MSKKLTKGYICLDNLKESDIRTGKNGKRYINFVQIPTESQYGDDFMVVADSPKGEKGTILGNARFLNKQDKDDSKSDQPFKFEL